MQGLTGIAGLLLLAFALSERHGAVPWRTVAAGLGLQLALALVLLLLPPVREAFLHLNGVVTALQDATQAGTSLVFGWLGGGDAPFQAKPGASSFILAFQALPLVLVMAALSALLYHWRILPAVVQGFAWALRRTLGVGGTAGVSVAANVFVGMIEAPLLVRPYLARASRADLFLIMVAGMATIAGTMMVIYASVLTGLVANPLGQLLTASLLNAPAAVVIARLMVPEVDGATPESVELKGMYANSMDAITTGTGEGLKLWLNIIAMLIVLVALVALADILLGLLPDVGGAALTLERMFGWVLAPVAWAMGIPWAEAGTAGGLLGTKIVLNEFVAYLNMAQMGAGALSQETRLILTYALCGFANFGSLGIMIGGLTALCPERRQDVIALGLKSLLAGAIVTFLTASLVGVLTAFAG